MTPAIITLGLTTFSRVQYLSSHYTAPFRVSQFSDITMFWKPENNLCHDKPDLTFQRRNIIMDRVYDLLTEHL